MRILFASLLIFWLAGCEQHEKSGLKEYPDRFKLLKDGALKATPVASGVVIPAPVVGDTKSVKIIVSPSTIMKNQVASIVWTNTGPPIRVIATDAWSGVTSANGKADVTTAFYRISDGAYMGDLLYDCYGPSVSVQSTNRRRENRIGYIIGTGDGIRLDYIGNPFLSTPIMESQHSLVIEYTTP